MPEPVQISPISILGDHTVTVARQSRHGGQVFREDMKNYREEALGNASIRRGLRERATQTQLSVREEEK